MQVVHHPLVLKRTDGRWIVGCRECQRRGFGTESPPIGIGVPVASEHEAKMMRDNHLGRRGRPIP
jgi:hypothetical protein